MTGLRTSYPSVDFERYRPTPKTFVTVMVIVNAVALAIVGPKAVLGFYALLAFSALLLATGQYIVQKIRGLMVPRTPLESLKSKLENLNDWFIFPIPKRTKFTAQEVQAWQGYSQTDEYRTKYGSPSESFILETIRLGRCVNIEINYT